HFNYATAGTRTVDSYEEFSGVDHPLGDIGSVATALGQNALATTSKDPPVYAHNVADLVRRRKGYCIVAVEGHTFRTLNPIAFTGTDASGNSNDGKHTFDFLEVREVTVGSRTLSIASYFCNMKSKRGNGNLGKGEWEDFQLEFFFQASEAEAALAPFEEGGTNMGPPPPPPGILIGSPE
ncbi:MAG TPA: hypothetical protein VE891_02200, partial [Allosphingosinicella sp.]|nr:hypothetical protein [Allosphingosinicella sp.]